MKIVQLKDNSQLKDFFEELVINKKQMTEEEFWSSLAADSSSTQA